jgi:hypothetical protein
MTYTAGTNTMVPTQVGPVFSFTAPTVTPSYCGGAASTTELREITVTTVTGSPLRTNPVTAGSINKCGCTTEPCNNVCITDNTYEHTITFKIRTKSHGPSYSDSALITI